MFMAKKYFALLWASLISAGLLAQVKVGQWRDHLSYNSCNTVAKAGNIVYASNKTGLLKFNTSDNSVERLNKINGLSDINIDLLRYNPSNDALLVIYDNANIDVIRNGSITNFSDIKRKAITGKKNINEVTFRGNIAYLACGFGIVVFDTDKLEIKDTYYIGPSGNYTNVYQVAFSDTTILAATSNGIRKANLSTFLNNYQNWSTVTGIPAGTYNAIVRYGNKIVANYSPFAYNGTYNQDTLYSCSGGPWAKDLIIPPPYTIKRLLAQNSNYLSLINNFGFAIFDPAQVPVTITNYPWFYTCNMGDVFVDLQGGPTYWIADLGIDNAYEGGLIKSLGPSGAGYLNQRIGLNGTHSNRIGTVFVSNGNVVTSPVVIDETGAAQYNPEGLNYYNGTEWEYIRDTILDVNRAIIDPNDPKHIWAASWIEGLVEYKNGSMAALYNDPNSIPHIQGYSDWHRVAGLAIDGSNNLWIGCSDVRNFLSVRKTDGTFQNFDFSSITSLAPQVGRLLADKNNQIWVLFPRGLGIAVYKNDGFSQPNASNTKFLTTAQGQGKLPDPYVYSIAEDLDGHIWVGTSVGVAVFYSPANITGGGDYDCQQILITQDTHVQILLETEKVNAIAVDGANQKWVGTDASGVYCFSPDGQTEIFHFTTDNSPLFSNTVIDIAYDDVSGDIYIGTDQGLQSYRGAIVKAEDQFNHVHAYPNPVRPGYGGSVYVRGLVSETVVKITDIAGNLVWETKSQGGQVEWPLKNLKGQRVASGVYMAFCSTTDGTSSTSTKIMVLN